MRPRLILAFALLFFVSLAVDADAFGRRSGCANGSCSQQTQPRAPAGAVNAQGEKIGGEFIHTEPSASGSTRACHGGPVRTVAGRAKHFCGKLAHFLRHPFRRHRG